MKQLKMLLLASMVIFFTACGGGSSSGGSAPSNPINPETPQTIAIAKIMLYANDNNRPAPTVEDYADAGITGVTADNIADINAEVTGLTAEDVNTTEKIQALVDDLPPPDTTAPVITIKGNNPETVIQGDTYTDAGATATDDIGGTVAVTTTGSVDTSTVGTYTITYTAKDNAGNTATETRTVNVVLAPPIIVKFLDLMKQPSGDDVKVLFTYDGDGNRLTEKRERADDLGVSKHESQYSYDFNTNEATETWVKTYVGTNYSSDATGTNIYTFDDKGVVLTIFISSSNGYTVDVVYTYNEDGSIFTSKSKHNYSDGSTAHVIATYGADGNRVTSEYTRTSPDGTWRKNSSTYDTNGNVLTDSWEDSQGNSGEGAYAYTYDADGNLIKREYTSTSSDGQWHECTSTYDENGNFIDSICDSGNLGPIANAGVDIDVSTGETVTLDGSASLDPDGSSLAYQWSFESVPNGSNAKISDTTSSNPTFIVDIDGVYTVQLIVNDEAFTSSPDIVKVFAYTPLIGDTRNANEFAIADSSLLLDASPSSIPVGGQPTLAKIVTENGIPTVQGVLNKDYEVLGVKVSSTHVIIEGRFTGIANENGNDVNCSLIAMALDKPNAEAICITQGLLGGVLNSCGDGLGFTTHEADVYFSEVDSECFNGASPITYNKLYKWNPDTLESSLIYDFGPNTSSDYINTNGKNFYVSKIAIGGDMGTSGAYVGNPNDGFTFLATGGSVPVEKGKSLYVGNSLTNQNDEMLFKYNLDTNGISYVSAPYSSKPGMNLIEGESSWESSESTYWINGNALSKLDEENGTEIAIYVKYFYPDYEISKGLHRKQTVLIVGTPVHGTTPTTEYIMTKIDLENDTYFPDDMLPWLGLKTVQKLENYVDGIIIYGTNDDGIDTILYYNVETDSIDSQVDDMTPFSNAVPVQTEIN